MRSPRAVLEPARRLPPLPMLLSIYVTLLPLSSSAWNATPLPRMSPFVLALNPAQPSAEDTSFWKQLGTCPGRGIVPSSLFQRQLPSQGIEASSYQASQLSPGALAQMQLLGWGLC